MSSVASDASSSRGSVDADVDAQGLAGTLPLSTKERRRERNRLAAQKHRLRRNERMSQLEQQVLALQHEKSQLLHRLETKHDISADRHAPDTAAATQNGHGDTPPHMDAQTLPPPALAHVDPNLDIDMTVPPTKRPRTADRELASDHGDHPSSPPPYTNGHTTNGHYHPLQHGHSSPTTTPPPPPIHYEEMIRRMEERIVELERWSEDLNGDLADALDSEARLKADLHHTSHAADAHLRRLQESVRASEQERARHMREAADLRDALDAEAAATRTLRDANYRLRESMEAAEETLSIQRAENSRLRTRLAEEDGAAVSATARLQDELIATRAELEDVHVDNRRLRKLLREQEAQEAAVAEARQRKKEREEEERRRLEAEAADANERIASLSARVNAAEAAAARHRREAERGERALEESEAARAELERTRRRLESSLEKVGAFLASKGIAVRSDDEDGL